MKIEEFIKKNNISISDKSLNLCREGLTLMEKSIDPIHDKKHVEDILVYLDYLINKVPEIKKIVMFDVLLLGICWHDTWKSFHKTNNPIIFIYHQIIDGIGSARIFRRQAYNENLNRDIIREASYIIKKHSAFNIIRSQKIELIILLDLDSIEMWNMERISKTQGMFFTKKYVYRKSARMFYKVLARKRLRFPVLEDLIKEKKPLLINSF